MLAVCGERQAYAARYIGRSSLIKVDPGWKSLAEFRERQAYTGRYNEWLRVNPARSDLKGLQVADEDISVVRGLGEFTEGDAVFEVHDHLGLEDRGFYSWASVMSALAFLPWRVSMCLSVRSVMLG